MYIPKSAVDARFFLEAIKSDMRQAFDSGRLEEGAKLNSHAKKYAKEMEQRFTRKEWLKALEVYREITDKSEDVIDVYKQMGRNPVRLIHNGNGTLNAIQSVRVLDEDVAPSTCPPLPCYQNIKLSKLLESVYIDELGLTDGQIKLAREARGILEDASSRNNRYLWRIEAFGEPLMNQKIAEQA